jgi:hypothetical protein
MRRYCLLWLLGMEYPAEYRRAIWTEAGPMVHLIQPPPKLLPAHAECLRHPSHPWLLPTPPSSLDTTVPRGRGTGQGRLGLLPFTQAARSLRAHDPSQDRCLVGMRCGLRRYLYPTESDGEVLSLYEAALTTHHLDPEKNFLIYHLAVHHLAFATIFADESRRWSAGVMLKRLGDNGSAELVRAIASYRPQATWNIAGADMPSAWSENRVLQLDDEQRLRLATEMAAA